MTEAALDSVPAYSSRCYEADSEATQFAPRTVDNALLPVGCTL